MQEIRKIRENSTDGVPVGVILLIGCSPMFIRLEDKLAYIIVYSLCTLQDACVQVPNYTIESFEET